VRAGATAGGTVSEVLRYLLDERVVDGVAVTRLDCSGGRPRPVTWIATDVADLERLHGSIYMTAPVNTILRTIRRADPNKRFAVVALGCHTEGLRAAQRRLTWVRKRIPLVIGLFCGHGVSPLGTQHLLRRLHVSPEHVREIAYRHGPMPGRFRVVTKHDRRVEMPMKEYGYMLSAYGNGRCWTCVDPLCELADMSIGDAWLPELRGRGDWNITIVRTAAGAAVIDTMIQSGRLRAEPTTPERVNQAQRMQLYLRERGAWARMQMLRRLGNWVPRYRGVAHQPLRRSDYVRALCILAGQKVGQNRIAQSIMPLLVGVAQRIMSRRSKGKDALIGRDANFRETFFTGDEYEF